MVDFLSTLTTDATLTTDTLHTSAVDLISSIHGHQRRAERAIEKKDLQSAVLHGHSTRERQERLKNGITQIRYKYTFADIVYITDVTSTREITSWVLPLPLDSVRVSDNDQHQYNAAVSRIAQDPKIITSHSVFVIDCSGSMKSADVEAHRCRADAVSYSVASEFIAKRLHNPSFGVTPYNVVTVIEMRDDAQIVFKKEPMSWVFYNKFVQRSKTSKPSSHGSYIPSLDLAMQALKENDHEHLALFLFFLSDGRPSDEWLSRHGGGLYPSVSRQDIYRRASAIGSHFQERLNFGMVGFGRPFDDLSVLNEMANQLTIQGAVGSFHRSDLKKINSLSTSLANMSSTLTKTCTLLTNARVGDSRKERSVTISQFQKHIIIPPNDWDSKTVRQNRLVCYELTRFEKDFVWKERRLLDTKAAGISFSNDPFGRGAERLVYQLREIDVSRKIVGTPLVAKDGRFVEDYNQLRNFHFSFCKTQKIAANLAVKFNQRLEKSPQVAETVPRIKFLDCFVYTFYDEYDEEINYLVEKQLDHNQYRKWNDNQGGIQGQKKAESPYPGMVKEVAPLQMLKDLKLKPIMSDIIEEENSEDEDDDVNDDETSHHQQTVPTSDAALKSELDILNEDVPQAFSHFTHTWSKRKRMVCDLQGVLDASQKPPMFELTDPVIHYKSGRNREHVYGKTDKGQKGINDFFQTHKCNNLCRALGIFSS